MNKNIEYGDSKVSVDTTPTEAIVLYDPTQDLDPPKEPSYGDRMAWWRENRPSLDALAETPAGLSQVQQKAFDKRERKRKARLAKGL